MCMTINFLWIGDSLGKLEQLSLKSFLDNGHDVALWAYNKLCTGVPSGVRVCDANEILDSSRVFAYKGSGDCRVGSYGGFSDLFRYYLLRQVGGWYCDTDVTCLKNFESIGNTEYLFRPHLRTRLVGNIMKCPIKSSFLLDCIQQTEANVTDKNNRWIYPVEILRDNVIRHGLEAHIAPIDWFGQDDIEEIRKLLAIGVFTKNSELPQYAIHWCSEATKTGRWDKSIKRDFETPLPTTLFYNLLKRHDLL